ncbi:myb domain-containing protein, partial [Reticulomyxa filosa]
MTVTSFALFKSRYDKIVTHFLTDYKNQSSTPKQYKETKRGKKHYKFSDKKPSGNMNDNSNDNDNDNDNDKGSASDIDTPNGNDNNNNNNNNNGREEEGGTPTEGEELDSYLSKIQRKSSGPRSFDQSKKKDKKKSTPKGGEAKQGRDWGLYSKNTPKTLSPLEIRQYSFCDDPIPNNDDEDNNNNDQSNTNAEANGNEGTAITGKGADVNLEDSDPEDDDDDLLLP